MDPHQDITVDVLIDEKSQIQALDCTEPGLAGQARKMRDDDHMISMRNGTTTLFAALNIPDGTVIGCCSETASPPDVYSPSSTPSSAPCRPEKSSTPSSITMPPAKTAHCPQMARWIILRRILDFTSIFGLVA